MRGCSNNFYNGEPQLITFIPKKVGYNPIRICMNPLAENKYIQKQQAIMKKIGPEISLENPLSGQFAFPKFLCELQGERFFPTELLLGVANSGKILL
jgi:hypothetical protein